MGNSGKNSNSSQFFITFDTCPQCDGKHTIFGRVVSGWSVLDAIEKLGAQGKDGGGEPTAPITITDCGIWKPQSTPGAGFWYDQPDPDSYSGMSPMFIVRPRVAVVGPSLGVVQKFQAVLDGCDVLPLVSSESQTAALEAVQERVVQLLNEFAVDVVVVAPACSQDVALPLANLDESWNGKQAVVQAKPVQALKAVRQQTWLAGKQAVWQFDGLWN